jgi:hypothetical protein
MTTERSVRERLAIPESRLPIDLLRPYESDGMMMTSANRLVGNVRQWLCDAE